jgi:uncharacterized protein involved in exopolysaccharide biosynthesis
MKSLRESQGLAEETALPGPQPAANTVRSMPATGPQQVFFHLDFRRSFQMHRKLAASIVLTALVLSLGYMVRRWNTWKAQALVYVQPSPHKVIENGPGQQWPYDSNTYESYIQQQVHDATRPDVLAGAVKGLPGWQGAGESLQSAADRLGSAVEVTRVGTAYEVQIESTAGSAQEAAQIANAVAASYIESATREQRAGDPERLQLLRDERDRILKELATDRSEQEDLSRKLGVAAVSGTTPDPIDDQITQTRAELVKARTASDEAAAKLTALAGGKASSAAIAAEADELVAADPGLVSMKTALNKRRSDLISQMANLTPNHPQYKQNADELAKINASLETMSSELRMKAAAQIQQKLKNDLERTSSVEARLNGQLAQLTGAAGTAAPRMQRLNELGVDVQRLQNRYTVVDEQYRNLAMENNSPGAVYLASAALPPLHAARAKVLRNGFILIVAGLVLALGAALVAHNLDPRIYIAQDVERVLGIPPMAQLPDLSEVGAGVAEEYMLRVAAAVEHAHQQGFLSSCIFTGVAAGAGVTTVSASVSSMLEAMGRETVLVDAVGSPQGRAGEAGSNPGTDLVHAPRGSRSTALLQQMNEEIADDSVVITDTAPLLVSGETEYLARFVDSAIVVVESGVTTKAQLREVAQTLQRLEVSSVGFVLNRISLKHANPAFLQSVRAVEAHLQAQPRPLDRAPERPATQSAPESAPQAESIPSTPVQPLNFERLWNIVSEPTEPTAASAEAAPESRFDAGQTVPCEPAIPIAEIPVQAPFEPHPVASRAPEPVVVDRDVLWSPKETIAVRPEPPAALRSTAAPVSAASAPSASASAPERQPEPSSFRTPGPGLISRPLRGREPAQSTPVAENRAAVPPIQVQPIPPPVHMPAEETVMEAPVARVTAPAFTPASPAARFEDMVASTAARMRDFAEVTPSHMPPPQQVQHVPVTPVYPVVVPAAPELQPAGDSVVALATRETEPEVPRHSPAASRLGGLRTLMTSLGIKSLHREPEPRRSTPELDAPLERSAERPVERPTERAVFAQPEKPINRANSAVDSGIREVKAQPEIIPPQAESEVVERETPSNRPTKPARVSRWDTLDDVETLPSKRGQYRKRR